MSFPNIWHHRKVAETASKGCEICYKPTSSVLVTPDSKDFFYTCFVHLKDRGFCTPIIDQNAVAAAKKKKEMEEELERVKKEYEEKKRKKEEREKKEEKEKEKDKEQESDKDKDKEKNTETKEPEQKDSTKAEDKQEPEAEPEARVFSLSKHFYQQRLNKRRQADAAKRLREQMKDPGFFPSVPKNLP